MAIKFVVGGIFLGVLLSESIVLSGTANTDTLKLVQVIFRHGDRAPTKFYPKDPYINDFDKLWPEGFAQLTNMGKMQQYELGKFLRQRYDGYLAKKYSQNELYVTSSDMDRTIMSLESNLAGLFPPIVNPWNPNLDWQPIPLRTIPRKEDKFLHNSAKCPKLSELKSSFNYWSDVARKTNQKHKDFIRYCAEHSGLEITNAKGLYPLLDILYAQASHNYTLPKWAQGDTLQKLLDIHGIVNTWPTYTDEMKRLGGGPFLHLLLKNMQAIAGHLGSRISRDETVIHSVHKGVNRKMLMYSAHDSTLARIMNTMGVFDPHCPPYASALIIELHKDQDSRDYFIEFHYRNDTTRDPYVLTHNKCGHPCKLQNYLEITRPLIPINWIEECQLNSGTDLKNPAADPNYFTLKEHQMEENDDDDHVTDMKIRRNILKRSRDNPDDWFTPESSCFPNSSQLVMLGFGLIISSILWAVIIVKVLHCRSGKNYRGSDYVTSSGRPLFVELFGRPTSFYRSTYERL